jgi:hypothetical protein
VIGKVSIADMKINYFQNNLDTSWKALEPDGNVNFYVSATNNFKESKPDNYQLMEELPVNREHFVIDVKKVKSSFYKVIMEGRYNLVNKWSITAD